MLVGTYIYEKCTAINFARKDRSCTVRVEFCTLTSICSLAQQQLLAVQYVIAQLNMSNAMILRGEQPFPFRYNDEKNQTGRVPAVGMRWVVCLVVEQSITATSVRPRQFNLENIVSCIA